MPPHHVLEAAPKWLVLHGGFDWFYRGVAIVDEDGRRVVVDVAMEGLEVADIDCGFSFPWRGAEPASLPWCRASR